MFHHIFVSFWIESCMMHASLQNRHVAENIFLKMVTAHMKPPEECYTLDHALTWQIQGYQCTKNKLPHLNQNNNDETNCVRSEGWFRFWFWERKTNNKLMMQINVSYLEKDITDFIRSTCVGILACQQCLTHHRLWWMLKQWQRCEHLCVEVARIQRLELGC